MNLSKPRIVAISVLVFLCRPSYGAAGVIALTPSEQAQRLESVLPQLSTEERLVEFRNRIREGPYGEKGLNSIFKNFEGKGYIDPSITGVEKTVNLAASDNFSIRKGATRTLLYGTVVGSDPRFRLTGMNKWVNDPGGKTDIDLEFEHSATGAKVRLEVKDVIPQSQQSDLDRIKRQIDLMAEDYQRTGRLQYWVNRYEAIPEIKKYAREKGVVVYDNMKQNDFKGILDDIHVRVYPPSTDRGYPVEGGVDLAFGALMLYNELPPTYKGIQKIINGEDRSAKEFWGTGDHLALATSGASLLSAGIANILKFQNFSKWAGRAGWLTFGIAEGVSIYEWRAGYMNNREFYTSQGGIVVGFGGVLVGQQIGGWIGGGVGTVASIWVGPEVIPWFVGIGKIGGGIAGGIYGSKAGVYGVASIYEGLDEKQKEETTAFIYRRYGVAYP